MASTTEARSEEAVELPLRGCESCGQVDTDPRVVHYLPPNHPDAQLKPEVLDKLLENKVPGAHLREMQELSTVIRHHDCCAKAGCPTGECVTKVEKAKGVTGEDLRKHIQSTYKAGAVS